MPPLIVRQCEVCGKSLAGKRSDATVCSRKCYESRRSKLLVQKKKSRRDPNCDWCGNPIPDSRRSDAVTCSVECNLEKHRTRKKQERWEGRRKTCIECGGRISESEDIRTLYCSDKCRDAKKLRYNRGWQRSNRDKMYIYHKAWAIKNYDVVAAHRHRRRAILAAAFVEDVNSLQVFEEGHWICGICGGPIDRLLEWPNPGSKSIDHIVPLSKGGKHERSNVQAAHFGCNSRKRDRLPALEGTGVKETDINECEACQL